MKRKILAFVLLAFCCTGGVVYGAEEKGTPATPAAVRASGGDGGKGEISGDYPDVLILLERLKDKPAAARLRQTLTKMAQSRQEREVTRAKKAYEKNPDDPYVVRAYASALFLAKRYGESIPVFERTAALDKDFAPRAHYYIGMARYYSGQYEACLDDLAKARDLSPQSREGKNAARFLADLERKTQEVSGMERPAAVTAVPGRPTKEKPWAVTLAAGMEYDTNVALIPSEQTRPSDISSDSDWRAVYSLGGVYEFVNTGKNFVGIRAAINGTQQFKDDMFNVQTGNLNLYYKGNFADTFQVRLAPFAGKTLLKAASYSWLYGITPGVSWQPVDWTWTDLDYTYSKVDFTDPPQYPEENRSGKNHNVTLRQNLSFPNLIINKRTTFFAGWLNYARSDTDGSSYANHAEGFGILGQQEFPKDFSLLVSYNYTKVKYDNANIRSATNEKRDDTAQTVTANVFKKLDMLLKNLSAYAGYRWFRNDSNISNYYSYSSNTYSAGFTLDF